MMKLEGFKSLISLHESNRFTIYKAISEKTNKNVILKVPEETSDYLTQDNANLEREFNLLKKLKNASHFIQPIELIKTSTIYIVVSEDFSTISLEKWLEENLLSVEVFFNLALQLIDSIHELHAAHIIHKDINPANIFIQPETLQIKLGDLSISTEVSQEIQSYVNPALLEGTLDYISPEQTGRMNLAIDYRTDYYSLGVTFYKMLTGKLPFISNNILDLVYSHLTKIAPLASNLNPTIPNMLALVIDKLLAKNPDQRYLSMTGLKHDILFCQQQWQTKQTQIKFTLGEKDISDRLQIPAKLFGRTNEVEKLLAAFDHISQGAAGLLLVSGSSGMGKSSLIHEIQKPITGKKSFFIEGKFEALQRNIAYFALIQGIRSFIQQILAEDKETLAQYREEILLAIGKNGKVIIDVIPELTSIIGQQPDVPTLLPAENKNRFLRVFQDFIQALATQEHPLVMFLDDLQWADNSSLTLLNELFSHLSASYFLIIGAFRSNEIDIAHPLNNFLEKIDHLNIYYQKIELSPLKKLDISHLLMETLKKTDLNQISDLADVIYQKTQGNPFFVNELIKTLHKKSLITFSTKITEWSWDIQAIKEVNITQNVADLLIYNFIALPTESQMALKIASCIGYNFDLHLLSLVSEQEVGFLSHLLSPIIDNGFIFSIHSSENSLNHSNSIKTELFYRFAHDQIRDTVKSLLSDAEEKQIHLKIGRILLRENQSDNQNVFNILNQLDMAIELITQKEEKLTIAKLNLQAACLAKKTMSYQPALYYLQSGLALLADFNSTEQADLLFKLNKELAECYFLVGKLDLSEKSFNLLIDQAKQKEDLASIYESKVALLMSLVKHTEALTLGIDALRKLGFSLPKSASAPALIFRVLKIKWKVRKFKGVENLVNLAPITDPYHIALDRLFAMISSAAMQVDPVWFGIINTEAIMHAIEHGYSFGSITAFASYGLMLVCGFGSYQEGFAFSEVARKHAELLDNNLAYSKCFWTILVNHWFMHSENSIDYLLKYYQASIESGDLLIAGYNMCQYGEVLYRVSKPISEVVKSAPSAASALSKLNEKGHHDFIILRQQCLQYLANDESVTLKSINTLADSILATKNPFLIRFVYTLQSDFNYYLGNFEEAFKLAGASEKFKEITIGQLLNADSLLIYSLSAMRRKPSVSILEKKQIYSLLKSSLKKLKVWSLHSPANFLHKYLLLNAEFYRLKKRTGKAIQLYDKAINSAMENRFFQYAGIANECAAEFYISINKPKIAKIYLQDARNAYLEWGAQRKAFLIEKKYPHLFKEKTPFLTMSSGKNSTVTLTHSNLSIDYLAIVSSIQAISSIIDQKTLIHELLKIVMQNAGAEKSALLITKSENMYCEAEGKLINNEIKIRVNSELIHHKSSLPIKLINYICYAKEPILLDNASLSNQFSHDPYITASQCKSILCIPILSQNEIKGLVYLENNSMPGAFTKNHLSTLQILSSQAAISLENAKLYHQATHDPLTGLANRSFLYQRFQSAANKAKSKKNNTLIAILFLDLDGFKKINDTLGHEVGDKLLVAFANLLKECVRDDDLIVRLGGDEFVIMLEQATLPLINQIAERLIHKTREPFSILNHKIGIATSVGISTYPNQGQEIDLLLKQADMALYYVKAHGKGFYQFYDDHLVPSVKQPIKET